MITFLYTDLLASLMITKDMTMGEIVEKYPAVAEVFLEYGLHCVGCHVSSFETLEEGAYSHGMDSQTIEMMIRDANAIALQPLEKKAPSLTLTPYAAQVVEQMAHKHNMYDFFLRITALNNTYTFDVVEQKKQDDILFIQHNVRIIADPKSFEVLRDKRIDYIDNLAFSGFKVTEAF